MGCQCVWENVTIDDAPETGRLGEGWRGNGPMRISHFMGKDIGYEDGERALLTWTLAALAEKFAGRGKQRAFKKGQSWPCEVGGAYLSGRRLASDVDADARRREVCCNAVRPWCGRGDEDEDCEVAGLQGGQAEAR